MISAILEFRRRGYPIGCGKWRRLSINIFMHGGGETRIEELRTYVIEFRLPVTAVPLSTKVLGVTPFFIV